MAKVSFGTRLPLVAGACACGVTAIFLYTVDPVQHAIYPQCLLYRTTGLYCAGCGATRALHALLHGRMVEALHDNALFVFTWPLVLAVAGPYLIRAWKWNAWPAVEIEIGRYWRSGLIFFGVMLVFMVLRNLSGWPFELLKPL